MKKAVKCIPYITNVLVPSTAIASSLFAPAVLAAPGDLDPTFDSALGFKAGVPLYGPARAIQPLPDDEILFGGGTACAAEYYCSYYDAGFVGKLSNAGSLVDKAAAALLTNTEVLDFVLQPDGGVIAVGATVLGDRRQVLHGIPARRRWVTRYELRQQWHPAGQGRRGSPVRRT